MPNNIPVPNQVTTRLQGQVVAQDERITRLSSQLADISSIVLSIQAVVSEIPKTLPNLKPPPIQQHPSSPPDPLTPEPIKLLVRFGGTNFLNAHEALGSLFQDGDFSDYIEQFEALSALIADQSEDQSLGMFIRGLRDEVKNWVRALCPTNCGRAMELAKHVATATSIGADRPHTRTRFSHSGSGKTGKIAAAEDCVSAAVSNTLHNTNALKDDSVSDGECNSLSSDGLPGDAPHPFNTLKLAGQLLGMTAIILIDGGATHKFISKTLALSLGLHISTTTPLTISLGDGTTVRMSEICNDLSLTVGNYHCTINALVYDLGALDMILGIAWLGTLGDVTFNWQLQELKFWHHNSLVHLCGITSLSPIASLKSWLTTQYRHLQKDEIQRQIAELLSDGLIRPSQSSFSSPVILVRKKDSSWRLCIDYRALNHATIPDKYPIPVVEELLDELHGSKFFSKIDLKSGFYQVRMCESDKDKTAFHTHHGHYEFLVMPFGLTNALATFQALMNTVFHSLLRKGVLIFFDDILVYSSSWNLLTL
ncbi:hypothetical protein LXL04_023092 [Taraxacum kok-saghyz]